MTNLPYDQAPLWLKICSATLPAITAAIVGGFTVWLGSRQLKRTSELSEKQMQLSVRNASDQFGATLAAANMNYRAQVLSTNRQAWINALREDVANFIGKSENIGLHAKKYSDREAISAFEELSMMQSRIKLRLNPDEELSKKVNKAVREVYISCLTQPIDMKVLMQASADLESFAGKLLKNEWGRVKRGE